MEQALNDVEIRKLEEESVHLRRIFPEEVWLLIFDQLPNRKDMEMCCKASPGFSKLLYHKRPHIFFPQVFEILQSNDFFGQNREKRKGLHAPAKDKEHLKALNLRLVCKQWKKTIDELYEKRGSQLMFNGPMDEDFEFTVGDTEIESFLQHFKDTHPGGASGSSLDNSPFLSKTVFFSNSICSHEGEQYFDDIFELLAKYGHHISNCSLRFNYYFTSRLSYERLIEWLPLMKNLKHLRIGTGVPLARSEMRELHDIFTDNVMPKLEKLQSLDFVIIAPEFVRQFIRSNNHVTEISLRLQDGFSVTDIFSINLPNLTCLRMNLNLEDFEQIQSAQFSPKFSLLALTLIGSEEGPSDVEVFSVLGSKWGDTLTSLQLLLPRKVVYKNARDIARMSKECTKLQKTFLPRVTKLDVQPMWTICEKKNNDRAVSSDPDELVPVQQA